MKCPHCAIHFDDNWTIGPINWRGVSGGLYRTARCPECKGLAIQISPPTVDPEGNLREWRQVHPIGSNRGPVPPEVPKPIATDYVEACRVQHFSAKASAALARRCLQAMLHDQGYKDRNLANQIDQLLNAGVLPTHIHTTVDVIRNFGNFSAHHINDKTTLQIIDVQLGEAEWCLEILEALFDHFYVAPATTTKKKAELDAKLKTAGKPPSKS
jgi:hypothetical protein